MNEGWKKKDVKVKEGRMKAGFVERVTFTEDCSASTGVCRHGNTQTAGICAFSNSATCKHQTFEPPTDRQTLIAKMQQQPRCWGFLRRQHLIAETIVQMSEGRMTVAAEKQSYGTSAS